MKKISVIIPVYNVGKYLRECLDSVINQTLQDIEIIIIDDGSTDTSPQICDEYAAKDNRIIVIHKTNGGYGQACNTGITKSTGEYISIVEPDDYIANNMYEDLYKIAIKNNSDIVKSAFYENLQSLKNSKCQKIKWNIDDIPTKTFNIKECALFLSQHPSIWSCIYKREFLKRHNICFVEASGAGWTDNPFQVQTLCLAEKINYTDNAYYYWRKLNEYDSDDLKDWTIPFKRCAEIHKWLEEQNITNSDILLNLYKREIAYMRVVLGMKKIINLDECLNEIKKMCKRMDTNIISKNKNIQKEYHCLSHNPLRIRKQLLFKRFKHWLVSVRLNGCEKYINILGFQLKLTN